LLEEFSEKRQRKFPMKEDKFVINEDEVEESEENKPTEVRKLSETRNKEAKIVNEI
jgi:hypothetical protein